MKKNHIILLSAFLLSIASTFAQQRQHLLQGDRTPRLTSMQRDEIGASSTRAKGELIYNLETNCLEYWNGTKWVSLCTGNQSEGVKIGNTIWATRNVDLPGTFAENSWDYGKIYQWNSNLAWSTENPLINHLGGTTWVEFVDNDTGWEAVNNPCPEGWKVPNNEQIDELIQLVITKDEVFDAYVADYKGTGVEGVTITHCDNEIFFPLPKYERYENGSLSPPASDSYSRSYWSSSPGPTWNLGVGNTKQGSTWLHKWGGRGYGRYVRCVAEE
jgi:uncharacterized protein (TIGR02145 family)